MPNKCNSHLQGEKLASSDAYGVVKIWDIRSLQVLAIIDMGPHPMNRVAFDPASSVVATASNDGVVHIYNIERMKSSVLSGHEDAVQMVMFDRNQFVIFNPWKLPWNWIAFYQNSFVISPGSLYHLIRRDYGRLANEPFTSNPIASLKQ